MRVAVIVLLCCAAVAVAQNTVREFYEQEHNLDWRRDGPVLPTHLRQHKFFNKFRFQTVYAPGEYGKVSDGMKKEFDTKLGVKDITEMSLLVAEMSNVPKADAAEYMKVLENVRKSVKNDKLFHECLKVLNLENAGDPFQYVSHSALHGVRVAQFALKLYDAVNAKGGIDFATLQKKSKVNKATFRADVALSNLLHDAGYCAKEAVNANKWLHAQASMKVVKEYLHDLMKTAKLQADAIENAIGTHNYDKKGNPDKGVPGCNGKGELKATTDDVVTIGSKKVKIFSKPKDCTTGEMERTYTPARLSFNAQETLQVFLRTADNLDAQRKRLSPYQIGDAFMEIMASMYAAEPLRTAKKEDSDKATKTWKDEHLADGKPLVKAFTSTTDPKIDKSIPGLIRTTAGFNHFSFLHFYSNWIIDTIDVAVKAKDNWVLTVKLHSGSSGPASYAAEMPFASYYQIWRAAEALSSLKVGNTPLTDVIKITVSQGGKNLVTETPLRAFNPDAFLESDSCEEDRKKFAAIYKYDDKTQRYVEKKGGADIKSAHPEQKKVEACKSKGTKKDTAKASVKENKKTHKSEPPKKASAGTGQKNVSKKAEPKEGVKKAETKQKKAAPAKGDKTKAKKKF